MDTPPYGCTGLHRGVYLVLFRMLSESRRSARSSEPASFLGTRAKSRRPDIS
jgi:hypothetical protein